MQIGLPTTRKENIINYLSLSFFLFPSLFFYLPLTISLSLSLFVSLSPTHTLYNPFSPLFPSHALTLLFSLTLILSLFLFVLCCMLLFSYSFTLYNTISQTISFSFYHYSLFSCWVYLYNITNVILILSLITFKCFTSQAKYNWIHFRLRSQIKHLQNNYLQFPMKKKVLTFFVSFEFKTISESVIGCVEDPQTDSSLFVVSLNVKRVNVRKIIYP